MMQTLHNLKKRDFEILRSNRQETEVIQEISEVFKALCDPTRIRIVLALREKELCVHDLAALIDSSESNTSHQLRVLRSMKIVKYRKDGKQVFYSIDDEHISHLIEDVQEHILEE